MFKKMVDEFLNLERNKSAGDIGMFEAAILYDFAYWLDTRSPTLRTPVHAEQNGADLQKELKDSGIEILSIASVHRKAPRSNRSAGG